MEANDYCVLFTGGLLGFNKASCFIDADDEATGDLGVEGAAVTGLLDAVTVSAFCSVKMKQGMR